MKPALVVSIHDVSPRTQPAVAAMLAELAALGVARTSLLVIPDHHGRGSFAECAGWLRELERAGHEMVIHGYRHRREPRASDTARRRWTTEVYTAGEGEFYDLDEATAGNLVRQAQAEFAAAGLHPVGFIAPAWLLSSAAERAVAACGLRYTTRLRTLHDLQTGAVEPCQSLVWSVRAGWRRQLSLVWNRTLYARVRRQRLVRISLHPPDRAHPQIWRQIRALTARAAAGREVTTYQGWVESRVALPG